MAETPPKRDGLSELETLREIQELNHSSAAHLPQHVAVPIRSDQAIEALRNGPRGALVVAGIAVGILFIGWLAFYFLLFLPRGPIG